MIILLFALNVFAQNEMANKPVWGKTPNESLLQPMVSTAVINEVIEFKPIEGHHFNLKANNNCQTHKPKVATEKSIQCQFNEAGRFTVSLFICDDPNTFCKIEKVNFTVKAPLGYKSALKKRVSSNILYPPKEELKTPVGFIKNRAEVAAELARKDNKLLFITFSAQWCPACNMLYENVFQTKEFQKDTGNLVKLMLDVDSDISWDLKERFKVGGYPTTILTTSTLNEIGRFVGYRSPKAIAEWLKTTSALRDEPIELVQSKIVHLKDAAKDSKFEQEYNNKVIRLASWYIDQNENEKALSLVNDLKTAEAKRLRLVASMNVAKLSNDKARTAKAFKELLGEYPKDIEYVYWISDLAANDVDLAKKYLDKMEDNLRHWTDSSDLEMQPYTMAELYYAAADTYDALDATNTAQRHYLNCANEYAKLEKLSALSNPRGAPLERGFCLLKAKQTKEAVSLFESLAKQYKKEFAYNYYYARALKEISEKEKALAAVKKSLSGSYGDNFIRATTLKAQLELEMGNLNTAEKTIENALSKIYLPETTQIRTHRYVSGLKKVLKDVQFAKLEKEKKQ